MEKKFYLSRMLILLMAMMLPIFGMYGQSKMEITGKVTSSTEPGGLPGVNIVVKGNSTGTITSLDGNYTINASSDDVLIFSFMGYVTQEVAVAGRSSISVELAVDAESIEEVVVVGYGTSKKSHLTGAISSVKNNGLDEIPVARMDEALIGRVSGVTIQTTDASAGAAPTMHVRGIGSISADASPLIVVDGVAVDGSYLGSIDMNQVESIEILKDAASAAIYGSRGGNGIIMISTKKGSKGKTTFSFNSFVGSKFTPKIDVIPSVAEWSDFVMANNGGVLTDKMLYINQLGTNTNWREVMFDGGIIQSYSLSARGGNDITRFSISGSYLNDQGVLLTDSYKKYNLNLNVDTKINKVVEIGLSINPSYTSKRDFPIGIHDALRQSPWLPLYHDENSIQYVDRKIWPNVQIGDYAWERHFDNYRLSDTYTDVDISTTSNSSPLAKVLEVEQNVFDFKLFSNAYIQLNLFKGFKFKSSLGFSYRQKQDEEWMGSLAHQNGISAMQSDYDTDRYMHLVNENLFTYDKSFGKHDINAVAGIAFETWNTYSSDQTGNGYQFDYIHTLNAASMMVQSSTQKFEESLQSVLGRVNYAYSNKYLLSLSLRYDGSSKFGPDKKYGFFPAASVGWRITEEEFMKGIQALSNLKARFSYGVTGTKDGIANYQHMALLSATSAVLNGSAVTGFNATNIANPNLGWEQSLELNPGIDIGLFENRLTMSFDYYERTSKDLLLEQPIPSVTGFTTALVNIGEVKNSGFEAELSSAILAKTELKWTISLNLSKNKNVLVDFAGASGLISSVDSKRPAEYIALEGYPISSFYGFVYEKDIPLNYLKNPYYPIGAKAQDCYVKDLNGDGIIDNDDRAILGSPYPKVVWAMNNQFNFKGIDLSFMVQGSHGAKVRNLDPQYYENHFASNMDYITSATDPNFFPDAKLVKEKIYTDLCVQDASYIALRSINLGYSLPKSLIQKIGISKARVYVAGQNLIFMMADDYTSFNPEGIRGDDGSPLRGGYQVGAAPINKTITFGVNLEF